MSNLTVHLILCLAALAALVVLIVTGHEPNALITALLGGLIGGSGGNGFAGFLAPVSGAPRAQGGFTLPSMLPLLCMLALAGLMFTGGCSTLTPQTGTQKLEVVCASASAGIKSITPLVIAGKLTADETATVQRAIAVTSPVCGAATPPDYPSVAYAAVSEALVTLDKLRAKYGVPAS